MRTTGIVRKLDRLGRITLPVEIRRELEICPHDELCLSIVKSGIALEKAARECALCGTRDDRLLLSYKGTAICRSCAEQIKRDDQSRT